jgi:hypothetical protein
MQNYAILISGLFLLASNRWMSWADGLRFMLFQDVGSYQAIAAAAPGLPAEPIPFHHAQRIFAPYVVGLLSKYLQLGYPAVFWGLVALCAAGVVLLTRRALAAARAPDTVTAILLAGLILNPYSFRYFLIVPGMLQDLVFCLGVCMVLVGLAEERAWMVVGGASIAALGRQTALMIIPGILFWLLTSPLWQRRTLSWRVVLGGAVAAEVAVIYLATGSIAARFSHPSINQDHVLGLLEWGLHGEFRLSVLLEHCSRVFLPFALPVAILSGVWLGMGKEVLKSRRLSGEFYASLLIAAGICAQPFLAGPIITGRTAGRLATMGLVPALLAVAFACSSVARVVPFRMTGPELIVLFVALGVSSLHHMYTIVGPGDALQFALLHAMMAALVGVVFFLNARHTGPGSALAHGRVRS